MTLEQLAVDHPYYCSDSNYYSNEAHSRYTTFTDFYEQMGTADVDMNLCFRWDIHKPDEDSINKDYSMSVYLMCQRKGIFLPISIDTVVESDVPNILAYLKPHQERLKELWAPL